MGHFFGSGPRLSQLCPQRRHMRRAGEGTAMKRLPQQGHTQTPSVSTSERGRGPSGTGTSELDIYSNIARSDM